MPRNVNHPEKDRGSVASRPHPLEEYFSKAEALGGPAAVARLSELTGVSRARLDDLPNDIAINARFQTAMAQLKAELELSSSVSLANQAQEAAQTASQQLQTLVDLTKLLPSIGSEPLRCLEEICRALTSSVNVDRASIWRLGEDNLYIACIMMYQRSTDTFQSGMELSSEEAPSYFAALHTQHTLSIADAHSDPRTAEMKGQYLEPEGITALLDFPIWVDSQMVGVVCHEEVGTAPRTWTAEEENYAYMVGSLISLALRNLDSRSRD